MSKRELAFEFAAAQAAYPGNAIIDAGDRYVIERYDTGIMVAVIDGLGHGPKAADAANAAVNALKQNPQQSPQSLMDYCHAMIRDTRGAAVTIASINTLSHQLVWLGVGNVQGMLVRSDSGANQVREHLTLRAGTVGYRLPTLRAFQLTVSAGDTLILTTDGIRREFVRDVSTNLPLQELADHILEHYKRDTDDALAVVGRATT